eukprot:SAG31_NODE_1261_length_9072_cov_39.512761_5_plen_203_part_00
MIYARPCPSVRRARHGAGGVVVRQAGDGHGVRAPSHFLGIFSMGIPFPAPNLPYVRTEKSGANRESARRPCRDSPDWGDRRVPADPSAVSELDLDGARWLSSAFWSNEDVFQWLLSRDIFERYLPQNISKYLSKYYHSVAPLGPACAPLTHVDSQAPERPPACRNRGWRAAGGPTPHRTRLRTRRTCRPPGSCRWTWSWRRS